MAWRTPRTWQTGDPLNKVALDTYIRDQQVALREQANDLETRVAALERAASSPPVIVWDRRLDAPASVDGIYNLSRSPNNGASWQYFARGINSFDPVVSVSSGVEKALLRVSMMLRTSRGGSGGDLGTSLVSMAINNNLNQVAPINSVSMLQDGSGSDWRTFSVVWEDGAGISAPYSFRPVYRTNASDFRLTLGGFVLECYPL